MHYTKKIIWVDIGTHFGQEYKSIFSTDLYFYWKILRTFKVGKLFENKNFAESHNLLKLIYHRKNIKKNKKFFHFTFIEANPRVLQKKIYNDADDIFCVATSEQETKIGRLFHANNDIISQGNSLYSSKENINIKQFTTCIIQNAKNFADLYKKYLDSKYADYQLILRLNIEGSEDDTIYAFHKTFKNKIIHVFGSLIDVKLIKGKKYHNHLKSFLKSNGIAYTKFSSSVDTWHKAFQELNRYIK